jgi:hypothetical protein
MPYELVREAVDIIPIIKRYIKILKKEKNGGTVIERFPKFSYWYYFNNISALDDLGYIFIPNKFLGYKIHATEPYNPTQGCGMNGTKARKALTPFFEVIEDEKRCEVLYAKLQNFVEKCNQEAKKNVIIFEPKDELRKLIEKENLNKKITKTTKAIIIKGNRGK